MAISHCSESIFGKAGRRSNALTCQLILDLQRLIENCRASRRVALQASVLALLCLFYLDTPWNPLSKIGELDDPKSKTTNINEEGSNKEGEEDVQVPDEMPEDAVFIPLGPVRQLPQTFYKGTDPEWQSFIEFSKDKKKSLAVRSKYSSLEPEPWILIV